VRTRRFCGIVVGVVVAVAGVMPIETIHGQGGISSRELLWQSANIPPSYPWEPAAIKHPVAGLLRELALGVEAEAHKRSATDPSPKDLFLFRSRLQRADRLDLAAWITELGRVGGSGFREAAVDLTAADMRLVLRSAIEMFGEAQQCEGVSHFLVAGSTAKNTQVTVFVRCDGLRRTDYALLIPSAPQPEPSVFRCGERTPCWSPVE